MSRDITPRDITPRQRALLDKLIAGKSVNDAAELVGISRRQAFRWLRDDPVFRDTLRQAQRLMMDATYAQVLTLAPDAVKALEGLLADPAQPGANVLRRTAVDILTVGRQYTETVVFEDRLAALEERLPK